MKRAAGWAALVVMVSAPAVAQAAAAPKSPLVLEGIEVEPSAASPGTLCKLRVKIRNTGAQDATDLAFSVKIGGAEVSTYKNHASMVRVGAGATTAVDLYSFWVPDAGPRSVEVTLSQARWMKLTREGHATVTTVLGTVEGLPVALTLQLK